MYMHWIKTKLLSNTREFESYKILNQVYVYVIVYVTNFFLSQVLLYVDLFV